MSKRRGTQHLKKNAPSLRAERDERRRREREYRASKQPPPAEQVTVNFYELALVDGEEGSEILHERASAVEMGTGDPEAAMHVLAICNQLVWLTEHDPNCLGIAAPQVRQALRIMSVKGRAGVSVWINPVIEPTAGAVRVSEWEGCFSLPDKRVYVERWSSVRVRGMNERGEFTEATFAGRAARAAQHELDHLDGTLISDHGKVEPVRGDVIDTGAKIDVADAAELRAEISKRA